MIYVSLLDFMRSGRFGPVVLGATRERLRRRLGEPDALGGTSRRQRVPTIWKYGDVEFHFGREADRLWMIFMDDFQVPSGGSRFGVDPWIIDRGLPLGELKRQLRALDVTYEVNQDEAAGARELVTPGGVHLAYHRPDGASNDPGNTAATLALSAIYKRDDAAG